MQTIAIDLDDTLNNFTETLHNTQFAHDSSYVFSQQSFDTYMEMMRSGSADEDDLLSTEYSFFRYRIHSECYKLASARLDGVAFMQWLRANNWRIVICTYRDLRRSNDATRKWLNENAIPFDYLFMAWNKLEFCKEWGIKYLVDDHLFNAMNGHSHGVQVFYPLMAHNKEISYPSARGFSHFDEVMQWIQK
jgi:hypothetical protein